MSKKAAVILGGLCVVAIGGQILTQSRFETTMSKQIEIAQQAYRSKGIAIERNKLESGFFGAKDTVNVTLTEDYLGGFGLSESAPLTLSLNNDCTFLPFYVLCDAQIESPDDDLAQINTVPHSASFAVNVLLNSTSGEVTIEQFSVEENDGTLTVEPLELSYEGDLSLDEVEAELHWKGMHLTGSSSGTEIDIEDVELSAEMSRVFDDVYASETELTFGAVDVISTAYNSQYSIRKITLSTEIEEEDSKTFELEYKLSIDDIQEKNQQLSISDFELDVNLDNISRQTLAYMNSTQKADETQQVEQMLADFGKTEHAITLEAFDFNIAQAPVKSSGALTLPPYAPTDIKNGTVSEKLSGAIDLSIGKAISKAFPAAMPVIEQYLQQGLLIEKDDTYHVEIGFNQGQVTANSIPVYQM